MKEDREAIVTIPGCGDFQLRRYIDAVRFWIDHKLDCRERRRLKTRFKAVRDQKKRFICDDGVTPGQPVFCFWIQISQPTQEDLQWISQRYPRTRVEYVEISFDFVGARRTDVDQLRTWLDRSLFLPVKNDYVEIPLYVGDGTLYLARQKRPRNIAIYSNDRAAEKVGGSPCAHVDVRVTTRRALRNLDIRTTNDLIGFDFDRARQKYLRTLPFNLSADDFGTWLLGHGIQCSHRVPARIGGLLLRIARYAWESEHERLRMKDRRFADVTDMPLPAHALVYWAGDRKWLWRRLRRCAEPLNLAMKGEKRDRMTDELLARIAPLLPIRQRTRGRPPRPDRDCMDAIIQVARGSGWRDVNSICPPMTAHDRFVNWQATGVFDRMRSDGLEEHPELHGVDWSWLCHPSAATA